MYSKYISINKNFLSSINLAFDLGNEKKIEEYIPTTDICSILKVYFKTFLGIDKDKSTTLVGPYGKGKSFLLLVLSFLVSSDIKNKAYNKLIQKIKWVDAELFNLIREFRKNGRRLLPVLINNSDSDLKQSFLIGLKNALESEKITDIVPETIFSECIKFLENWQNGKTLRENLFVNCLKKERTTYSELKKGLKNYSSKSFEAFKRLYKCISGFEFNPLIGTNIPEIYSAVVHEIKKYKFNGVFIIFDEFSKFLEDNRSDIFSNLKLIQDFAEKSNRSTTDEQINFCCVTHKSLNLYSSFEDQSRKDIFKTVEGRFKEIKFNRGIEENYQLISLAINKDSKYKKEILDEIHKSNFDDSDSLSVPTFNSFQNINKTFEGCFPLNPFTAFCLVQLSEKIAQNERTLFTFLSDSDENSLNSFIHNNETGLLNVYKLYDYFSPILKTSDDLTIRNIWYRSQVVLNKIRETDDRNIIKTLSIILMINDSDRLPATLPVISYSANLKINCVEEALRKFENMHFIRKGFISNSYSFASLNSKKIDEQLDLIRSEISKNFSLINVCNEVYDRKYFLPRRYNEEKKITRFFSTRFIDENTLINSKDLSLFTDGMFSDGIVLCVLVQSLSNNKIESLLKEKSNKRIVSLLPVKPMTKDLNKLALQYACLKEMRRKTNDDDISFGDINSLFEECVDDLRIILSNSFSCLSQAFWNSKPNCDFPSVLSEVMYDEFTEMPTFNNELINKTNVSKQYEKAINHVDEFLLSHNDEFNYSETSAENSIKWAILDSNADESKFISVINIIKKEIINSDGKKISVDSIVNELVRAPYGIRKGVIPVLISKAISELTESVILYLQNKEIDLNAENIFKCVYSPKDFYISASKETKQQITFLKNLCGVFDAPYHDNFRQDIKELSIALRKYFLGLPQIVRSNSISNNYLKLDSNVCLYRNECLLFNINPYELIIQKPISLFGDYQSAFDSIKTFKDEVLVRVSKYKEDLTSRIKELFNIDSKTSLKMVFSSWMNEKIKGKTPIFTSSIMKNIFKCISSEITFDDLEALNKLSKVINGTFIEDWSKDNSNEILTSLGLFKQFLEKNKKLVSYKDLDDLIHASYEGDFSSYGKMLERSIKDSIDDFSESISNEEKIAILSSILRTLI